MYVTRRGRSYIFQLSFEAAVIATLGSTPLGVALTAPMMSFLLRPPQKEREIQKEVAITSSSYELLERPSLITNPLTQIYKMYSTIDRLDRLMMTITSSIII